MDARVFGLSAVNQLMLVLRSSLASRFADALDAKAFEVGLEALSMGEALALNLSLVSLLSFLLQNSVGLGVAQMRERRGCSARGG